MSYVQTVLQPGETVRFTTNYHWIIYARGIALLVLACASYWMALRPVSSYDIWAWIALILFVFAAIVLFHAWFRRWITEIAVTDRRIIYKHGFIRRDTNEMALSKVESVQVDQSILGRILGYGNINVKGTGVGLEQLRRIASAIQFRNHVTAE